MIRVEYPVGAEHLNNACTGCKLTRYLRALKMNLTSDKEKR